MKDPEKTHIRKKDTRKRVVKQLLGVSIAWITGIALVGFAMIQASQLGELTQLKFIPVYAVTLLSAVALAWYIYTYRHLWS